jgi:phospholipid-binding lipoprotein MlaA
MQRLSSSPSWQRGRRPAGNGPRAARLLVALTGCVNPSQDRIEPVNRKVFQCNEAVDPWFIRPVAVGYVNVTPGSVRSGVTNFFDNLGYPWWPPIDSCRASRGWPSRTRDASS